MMTSKEIEATIERLGKLGSHGFIFDTDIVDAINDSADMFEVRDTIIALLRQADPDTHIETPVDADDVPIHINDEMVNVLSGEAFIVKRLKYSERHGWMIGGAHADDLSEYQLYSPDRCRHYHKPTVEELLFEFGKICQDGYDIGNNIHEYAEKIREAMADE